MGFKTKTCGIYVIRRVGSDECYVGQSVNIEQRWSDHRKELKRNRHRNSRMQNVFNKHGEGIFVIAILQTGFDPADKTEITASEQFWMDSLKPCYNVAPAAGSQFGFKHSLETVAAASERMKVFHQEHPEAAQEHSERMKKFYAENPDVRETLGNARRGKPGTNLGKTFSPETCAKISAAKKGAPSPNKGKPMSQEQKDKISAANKGKPSAFKGKASPWRGQERAAEVKANISKGLIALHANGYVVPDEIRKKMSEAAKRRWSFPGAKAALRRSGLKGAEARWNKSTKSQVSV